MLAKKYDIRKKVVTELVEIQGILHQYHSNPMGGHSGSTTPYRDSRSIRCGMA